MTLAATRDEALVGGEWYLLVGSPPAGCLTLRLPDEDVAVLPGEQERLTSGNFVRADVDEAVVERLVHYDVTTVYEGESALIIAVHDGFAELYHSNGRPSSDEWEGSPHDGWELTVLVEDLGEVTEVASELRLGHGGVRG